MATITNVELRDKATVSFPNNQVSGSDLKKIAPEALINQIKLNEISDLYQTHLIRFINRDSIKEIKDLERAVDKGIDKLTKLLTEGKKEKFEIEQEKTLLKINKKVGNLEKLANINGSGKSLTERITTCLETNNLQKIFTAKKAKNEKRAFHLGFYLIALGFIAPLLLPIVAIAIPVAFGMIFGPASLFATIPVNTLISMGIVATSLFSIFTGGLLMFNSFFEDSPKSVHNFFEKKAPDFLLKFLDGSEYITNKVLDKVENVFSRAV